jgi:hypothetical protein
MKWAEVCRDDGASTARRLEIVVGPCGDAVYPGKSGAVARRGRVFLAQVSP